MRIAADGPINSVTPTLVHNPSRLGPEVRLSHHPTLESFEMEEQSRGLRIDRLAESLHNALLVLEGTPLVADLMKGLRVSDMSLSLIEVIESANKDGSRRTLDLDGKGFVVSRTALVDPGENGFAGMESRQIRHPLSAIRHAWRISNSDLRDFIEKGVTIDNVLDTLSLHLGLPDRRPELELRLQKANLPRGLWAEREGEGSSVAG